MRPTSSASSRNYTYHLQKALILVMDRYSVHRSAARQLSAEGRRWFSVEWLPAYSPELDPVEAVWSHTKCVDLANFIPNDIDDLYYAVVDSLNEQARDASLKISYFDWAGLKI